MKLGLTIFFAAGIITQAFLNLSNFSVNDGIDMKSIVACSDCGEKK